MKIPNLASRTFISNFSFYVGWWACAAGARYGHPWAGPLLTSGLLLFHLYLSPTPKGELNFFGLLAIIGFVIDSLLIKLGLFTISPISSYAPLWLVCMWILMGMTFESMLMFRQKLWLNMILGGVMGPISYMWGESFNILAYQRPLWQALIIHGVIWAILTPLLFPVRDFALRIALRRG